MPIEFGHEGLAKAHDLTIRSPTRIEVGAALAAADRHAGQGIFEGLFKPQELDDPDIDGRMEAQPPPYTGQGLN